jgi:DNA-directed RNA polymerase
MRVKLSIKEAEAVGVKIEEKKKKRKKREPVADDTDDMDEAEDSGETEETEEMLGTSIDYEEPIVIAPKGFTIDSSKLQNMQLRKGRGTAAAVRGLPEPNTALPAHKQFVPLHAVLPPLPPKGDFSVETIKRSLYFFS